MELTLEQYEQLNPRCEIEHDGVNMVFSTPGTLTRWRVESIHSKEPWTLEWIASFQPDEILLDCGANVGMYTVWAAATRRVRVYAFEPESQNYALLNRNIQNNRLQHRVKAYCMGLSDQSGLFDLHMADMRVGGSCHAVGEALDFEHKPLQAQFVQGCVAGTLDELVAGGAVPVPNHIKIDVDGFEPKVIAGARATLADPRVRSLLIETNPNLEDHRAMVRELNALGLLHDPAQVRRAERKDGTFKGVAEHVFRR
ncbi:MAG: methyltransferase FkbM family [Proteobacteria bacterium]|nr:methyltransferase FkbM family [Pseudomonadota bacterium]RPJ45214.1 MAG: FkbM family methyltransferase [Betaproteobacteria bacterium]